MVQSPRLVCWSVAERRARDEAASSGLDDLLSEGRSYVLEATGASQVDIAAISEDGAPLAVVAEESRRTGFLQVLEVVAAARHSIVSAAPGKFTHAVIAELRRHAIDAVCILRAARGGTALALATVRGSSMSSVLPRLEDLRIGLRLASAVSAARFRHMKARLERLRDAMRNLPSAEVLLQKPGALGRTVARIRTLFGADVVTLLLHDGARLRLAASSDPRLSRGASIHYEGNTGLSGAVFRGRTVRLATTVDEKYIYRAIGLRRSGPLHPDRDDKGRVTDAFLGVPVRCGDQVLGVLRVSRTCGRLPFGAGDAEDLEAVARLLGANLGAADSTNLASGIFDTAAEAMVVARHERLGGSAASTRVFMANSGTAALLGRPAHEVCGLRPEQLLERSQAIGVRRGLRGALRRSRPREAMQHDETVQCQVSRADGTSTPASVSFRIIRSPIWPRLVSYIVAVARSTSEEERLAVEQRRLHRLLKAVGMAYFRADLKGFTLESSEVDSVLTGYSPEELRSLSREALYVAPAKRSQLLDEARKAGGLATSVVVPMRRKDGSLFWAGGDLLLTHDGEGRESGVEGFYRDVTARMELQQFLNEDAELLLSEAELLRRLKGEAAFNLDYVSSIGHQIQTPLSALVGVLENLERGIYDARLLRERLFYVLGQARSCVRLVKNLSYMGQILRGGEFERELLSLGKLAIETKLDLQHLLGAKRLRLSIDDQSLDALAPFVGHAELLRQVFFNLFDNAIKYSLNGTAIEVRGKARDSRCFFEVVNDGLRVSSQDRRRVFERGFRSDEAKDLVPYGTGLGLWLVKQIVELHGGEVDIECGPAPRGSRIVVRASFVRS